MRLDTLFLIRRDGNLYNYLKYHSHWYKILKRNPLAIKEMEQEMKKEYKLTTTDKLTDLTSKIQMVRTFLDVLK